MAAYFRPKAKHWHTIPAGRTRLRRNRKMVGTDSEKVEGNCLGQFRMYLLNLFQNLRRIIQMGGFRIPKKED